jgi:Icc-related predicted phosphoesterase
MVGHGTTRCFFVSDLHGRPNRYDALVREIERLRPGAVFIGGDLLSHALLHRVASGGAPDDFIGGFVAPRLRALKRALADRYPRVFVILGNDDPKADEAACVELAREGLWQYIHDSRADFGEYIVYGYANVPPTPFLNKDWERYDVSRYVPPGSVSPEEGWRTEEIAPNIVKYATIKDDIDRLAGAAPLDKAVFLFHTPPHETNLDRVAQDGRKFEGVPLDLHVGSIAVRRFIEARQPLLTLHGHIHESARLTGSWRDRIGRTHAFTAAHDGPELALVDFDLDQLEDAERRFV